MSTYIIDQEYKEPYRPYSQKELLYNRDRVFSSLRVGNIKAHHIKCDHFYNVKERGRKEKEIKETNNKDVGNCSVCWKLNKTPQNMRNETLDIIDQYCSVFYNQPKYLSFETNNIQIKFYKWLYEELN